LTGNAIQERLVMGFEQLLVKVGRWLGVTSATTIGNDRADTRNQCLIASEFSYFGTVDSALIKNLNRSGAFVETRKKFNVGEAVRLKFPLHYLDPPVEVSGVIAWTGSDGVGVKFNPIENQANEQGTRRSTITA
jgi:Tfp pilus assembly protein PilZ